MNWNLLYPFQKSGVRQVQEFDGRALLSDHVGLGKTLQSLAWLWKFSPDPTGPVVIVCPAHLRLNWQREVQRYLERQAEILYGLRVPKGTEAPTDPDQIYILSYNSLVPPHWKPRTVPPEDSWLNWLSCQKPRLIIGDEAHALQDASSARTRAFRRLSREIPHVLLLTATPLINKPQSLWALLNILRPELFPSFHDYCAQFTFARLQWWGWEFKGARNLDILNNILTKNVLIRRRKQDVLSELPIVTHSVIPLEIDLREYRKAERNFLGWLEQKAPLLAKSAAKAQQLSKMNALKKLAGEIKVPAVIEWTREFLEESESKLLMGAIHYDVTEPIVEEFSRRYGAVLVDGRVSAKNKDIITEQFNADPRCRLMVGNMEAAGSGWSCRSTSDVAIIEEPWRPGDITQFAGRVDGIARGIPGTAAQIRHLIAAGTVEEDLCNVLQTKSTWSDIAIDGGAGGDVLNIYDQVVSAMRSRAGW